jgi:hypothetical protein
MLRSFLKIQPYYMTLHSSELKQGGIYSIRIKPGNRDATVDFIDRQFRQFFPDAIVEVSNFDKDLDLGTKDVWEIVESSLSITFLVLACCGMNEAVSFQFGQA